eukprot:748601-Hanusia_phi.AAC.3
MDRRGCNGDAEPDHWRARNFGSGYLQVRGLPGDLATILIACRNPSSGEVYDLDLIRGTPGPLSCCVQCMPAR